MPWAILGECHCNKIIRFRAARWYEFEDHKWDWWSI